ncbi:MAG: SGNH/GDSL hydrolase family protein [Pirellulales bacterium]|nr:SGNH/GDSL hydrolase family protein [Pirellulales bacterium]
MTRICLHVRARRTAGLVFTPFRMACLATAWCLVGTAAPAPSAEPAAEVWVPAMKKVHAEFNGEQGTFALFGDSITVSKAFWLGLQYTRNGADAEMVQAFELVKGYMLEDCWDRRGPEYGNQGRMTIRWAHENVDAWLKNLNPEVALIMFGTNDLGSLALEEYETKTRQVVQKCLDNGTMVILSTIPPKHGQAEKAAVFAEAVRRIARDLKVPLTDYHAEILKRRPDDWDGAMEKFSAYQGYDVPTLISRDGVHPSNPRQYAGDYSAEGLRHNGFNLRSYLALIKYAEVIDRVLPAKAEPPEAPRRTLFFQDFERDGDWDGTVTDKGTPASNRHVVVGHARDEYYGRKIRVGTGNAPPAMAKTTYLTFDYYVEGTDFLMVFLFDLDINDNCRYPIHGPVLGKWTRHTIKVTRGGPLKPGHKVDDLFFFAGEAGSRTARLMVDNVRIEGSEPAKP